MLPGTYNPFAQTALQDITITDDGDNTNPGAGTAQTWVGRTSTGPATLVAFFAATGASVSATSATWGANPGAILHQEGRAGYVIGWIYFAGAQSGDLTINFSISVNCWITVASLDNLVSGTPVDTDEDDLNSVTSITLDNLASPGVGGIRLAVAWHEHPTTAASWTNATGIASVDVGSMHYSVAYDLGDDATTITASFPSSNAMICGVSLR